MPHVVALYRYPVKGHTPEACESLTLLANGRVAGDRVLSFRFAGAGLPQSAWSRKYGHAVLANAPGIARLHAQFDHSAQRLRIALGDDILADEVIDEAGRKRIASAVERYVLALPDNPLSGHPERLPLELIGDGVTPRYADSEEGQITLHSRESLADAGRALHDPALDEVRFRSNIAIEGVHAWEEQEWLGKRLRIGEVELEVVRPKTRCLATHANPETGERDLQVMPTLARAFQQAQPTFAVAMMTRGAGGDIRLGDAVKVLN
jgi:uncharacterized protein